MSPALLTPELLRQLEQFQLLAARDPNGLTSALSSQGLLPIATLPRIADSPAMKTTVTIEDDVSAQLARAAQSAGVDVNKLVNDIIRQGLKATAPPLKIEPKPFVQRTYDLGLRPEFNWDKASAIADSLEDEAILAKLRGGR